MTKLQHISWTAILLILSSCSIDLSHGTTISREVELTAIAKRTWKVSTGLSQREIAMETDRTDQLAQTQEFEKLAPIIGISAAESTPKAYAKILQVIGLINRHGKAYLEFDQLVQLLKKWEAADKAIALVRQEYTESKYDIPAEFKQDLPGWNTYQKYAEYLPDL
jgi:hypothetical protein